jgi:hypothetical protein
MISRKRVGTALGIAWSGSLLGAREAFELIFSIIIRNKTAASYASRMRRGERPVGEVSAGRWVLAERGQLRAAPQSIIKKIVMKIQILMFESGNPTPRYSNQSLVSRDSRRLVHYESHKVLINASLCLRRREPRDVN